MPGGVTVVGMMLKAVPPWMRPIVTTAESRGEISRDTMDWSASTTAPPRGSDRRSRGASRRGRRGRRSRSSNSSTAAMSAPRLRPIFPTGSVFQRCSPNAASTPSSAPSLHAGLARRRGPPRRADRESAGRGRGGVGSAARPRRADRHVAVVAAGVHAAGDLRGERLAGRFLERQARPCRRGAGGARPGGSGVGEDSGLADAGARREAEAARGGRRSTPAVRAPRTRARGGAWKSRRVVDETSSNSSRRKPARSFSTHAEARPEARRRSMNPAVTSSSRPSSTATSSTCFRRARPGDRRDGSLRRGARRADRRARRSATLLETLARSIRRRARLRARQRDRLLDRLLRAGGRAAAAKSSTPTANRRTPARRRDTWSGSGLLDRVVSQASATPPKPSRRRPASSTSSSSTSTRTATRGRSRPRRRACVAAASSSPTTCSGPGKVVDPNSEDNATEGIREFNRRLFALPDFRSVIVPLRDGVAIARKAGVRPMADAAPDLPDAVPPVFAGGAETWTSSRAPCSFRRSWIPTRTSRPPGAKSRRSRGPGPRAARRRGDGRRRRSAQVLFDEEGFGGDSESYDEPSNSSVARVLVAAPGHADHAVDRRRSRSRGWPACG